MRIVRTQDELLSNFDIARSEALASFGNDQVYVENILPIVI